MAGISIKELFEALAKLSGPPNSSPRSRHWISPHWEVTSPQGGPNDPNNTRTRIKICNLNTEPVAVTINFFNFDGTLQSKANATQVNDLPPNGQVDFFPADVGRGWLELIATAPIYPSGYITQDAAPGVFHPGNPDALMETVGFAMTFYALVDE